MKGKSIVYGRRHAENFLSRARAEFAKPFQKRMPNPEVKRVVEFTGKHVLQPGDVLVIHPDPHEINTRIVITDQKQRAKNPVEIHLPLPVQSAILANPLKITHGDAEIMFRTLLPKAVLLYSKGHYLLPGNDGAYHKEIKDPEKQVKHLDDGPHLLVTHEGGKVIVHNVGKHPLLVLRR